MKTLYVKIIRTTLLILILAAIGGYSLIYFDNKYHFSTPTISSHDKNNHLKTRYAHESQWIIEEIGTYIVGMITMQLETESSPFLGLSVVAKSLEKKDSAYDLSIDLSQQKTHFEVEISIDSAKENIWSPHVYIPLVKKTLEVMNISPLETVDVEKKNDVFFETLLNPTIPLLEKENNRISMLLTKNSLDVSSQNDAAGLIGILALLEHAGYAYTDHRSYLNRMTAHLAIAETMAPNANETNTALITRCIQADLIGNKTEALKILESIPSSKDSTNTAFSSWRNALQTLITGDWREPKNVQGLSVIEMIAVFEAMYRMDLSEPALKWLKEQPSHSIPWDFIGRVINEDPPNISTGHVFSKGGVQQELYFIEQSNLAKIDSQTDLIQFLNSSTSVRKEHTNQGEIFRFEVLSKELWAGFFQRHLLHRLSGEYNFLKNRLGAKDSAAEFKEKVAESFSDLYLYPVFLVSYAESKEEFKKGMDMGMRFLSKSPELFTANAWHWLSYSSSYGRVPQDMPNLEDWFSPELPPGTYYDLYKRSAALDVLQVRGQKLYEEARVRDPYDYTLLKGYFEKQKKQTPQQFKKMAGKLLEYDIRTMNHYANLVSESDPAEYIETMNHMATLAPYYCFTLGQYLVDREMTGKAVKAYEKGIELTDDNVTIAGRSRWLVNYYYDSGEHKRAFDLADKSARTYSAAGLTTMAELLEKDGRLEEAEDYFKRIYKRYGQKEGIVGFYIRNTSKKGYKKKRDQLLSEAFPKGLVKVTLEDFTEKPEKGIVITSSSQLLHKYGLSKGDIIVALDGYKVENLEQYYITRGFTDSYQISFIVWSRQHYVSVNAELENRRFGVNIDTYR